MLIENTTTNLHLCRNDGCVFIAKTDFSHQRKPQIGASSQ